MLVKLFWGAIFGSEAISVLIKSWPGLGYRLVSAPKKASNQRSCLFSESLGNTTTQQISIYYLGANNIVCELSLYGSLQPIKITLPTAFQVQKEALKDFIQPRAEKLLLSHRDFLLLNKLFEASPMILELMYQPVKESEVALSGSLCPIILNSLSGNYASSSCTSFNEANINPDEIASRQLQETYFNSEIRSNHFQKFYKLGAKRWKC